MKKKIITIISVLMGVGISFIPFGLSVKAQGNNEWMSDPMAQLDNTWKRANGNLTGVQDTTMNPVTSKTGSHGSQYPIINTFEYIVKNLHHYLQYIEYAGLTAAVILVIWNGFMLVISKDKSKQMNTFKSNMIKIMIGVALLGGFYVLIEIFTSLVNLLTGD